MAVPDGSGGGSGHHGGLVAFAGGFRAPFCRYWLSGFLSDFGMASDWRPSRCS